MCRGNEIALKDQQEEQGPVWLWDRQRSRRNWAGDKERGATLWAWDGSRSRAVDLHLLGGSLLGPIPLANSDPFEDI